jgi:hypothetical protein
LLKMSVSLFDDIEKRTRTPAVIMSALLSATCIIPTHRVKRTLALLCLTIAIIIPCLSTQPSYAQFIPCNIVNLNPIPPTLVQAGQPFQVTSDLTISCDPSVLPVIRVDLLDPESSKTLSTTSLPYYPSSSSFTVSVINQATARQLLGSWPLQVQAYVINGVNGQSVASTSQLFQVNVQPYTPSITEIQTTEATTQTSSTSSISAQSSPTTTNQEAITEALPSTITFNAQTTRSAASELLLPAAIVVIGLAAFGLLVFAGSRRNSQRSVSSDHCGQCGVELIHDQNYCTNCGAKQAK